MRRSCYFFAPRARHTTADEPAWFLGPYERVCGHCWSNHTNTYKNKLSHSFCLSVSLSLFLYIYIHRERERRIYIFIYIHIFRLYVSSPYTHLSPFSCFSLSHTRVSLSLSLFLSFFMHIYIYIPSTHLLSLSLSLSLYIYKEIQYIYTTHTHTMIHTSHIPPLRDRVNRESIYRFIYT